MDTCISISVSAGVSVVAHETKWSARCCSSVRGIGSSEVSCPNVTRLQRSVIGEYHGSRRNRCRKSIGDDAGVAYLPDNVNRNTSRWEKPSRLIYSARYDLLIERFAGTDAAGIRPTVRCRTGETEWRSSFFFFYLDSYIEHHGRTYTTQTNGAPKSPSLPHLRV